MTKLTFRVISSSYLAAQVLHQVTQDHGKEFPRVAHIVETTFYVEDCRTRAERVEDIGIGTGGGKGGHGLPNIENLPCPFSITTPYLAHLC